MVINQNTLQEFRRDFGLAMAGLESKYGIKVELGSIKFNDTWFSGKLEVNNKSETGEVMVNKNEESKAVWYISRRHSKGAELVQGGVIGHYFILTNGDKVQITGYNSRASSYPLEYTKNGQNYKGPISCLAHRA